jgi:hypothetical protein
VESPRIRRDTARRFRAVLEAIAYFSSKQLPSAKDSLPRERKQAFA